jgi:hypothetical protein
LFADLEVVVQQLTEANEHLALRAAKVSEAELQEVQQEATDRLAAAERKVSRHTGVACCAYIPVFVLGRHLDLDLDRRASCSSRDGGEQARLTNYPDT